MSQPAVAGSSPTPPPAEAPAAPVVPVVVPPAAPAAPAPAAPPVEAAATPPAAPATPPAAPAATPPPAKPTAADIVAQLTPEERKAVASRTSTLAQILEARGISTAKPATPAAPAAPAAATPPAQPAAPADPNAAPAPATPAAPQPDGEELPDRFRFKNDEDKAVALIAKTRGVSLVEAARIYAGEKGQAAPPATPAQPATPAVDPALVDYDRQITETESKLADLTTQRKKAREDVELEKADELSDQIAELKSSLTLLRHERTGYIRSVETRAAQSYEEQANQSRDRALTKYTELQSEGSLHRMAFDSFVSKQLANPARAQDFTDPKWPEKLAEEFATQHGLKPNGVGVTPAAATPPAPAPVTPPAAPPASMPRPAVVQVPGARLPSSSDGMPPSGGVAVTKEGLLAALPTMTPAQRALLIRQIPARTR